MWRTAQDVHAGSEHTAPPTLLFSLCFIELWPHDLLETIVTIVWGYCETFLCIFMNEFKLNVVCTHIFQVATNKYRVAQ